MTIAMLNLLHGVLKQSGLTWIFAPCFTTAWRYGCVTTILSVAENLEKNRFKLFIDFC
jgi:hypothetical protein